MAVWVVVFCGGFFVLSRCDVTAAKASSLSRLGRELQGPVIGVLARLVFRPLAFPLVPLECSLLTIPLRLIVLLQLPLGVLAFSASGQILYETLDKIGFVKLTQGG